MLTLRPYQQAAITSIYGYFQKKKGNPLVVMPTGCHAAGTQILMFDGSTKPVEDVVVGDVLMGPDSKPRNVLRLARGVEPLYRITPKKGEAFVVNEGHVLSLQTTNEGKPHACTTTGKEIDNITVGDWLKRSKSWKHLRKLRRTAVEFPGLGELPLDPWCVGVLLGDGCVVSGVSICNPDFEVLREFEERMVGLGLNLRWSQKPNNKAYDAFFTDPLANSCRPNRVTAILRDLGMAGCRADAKFVPDVYKRGSRQARLEVLAGLIDTDGHYDGKLFDFISKSRRLAEDVVFIALSLGLFAKVKECRKGCQTGAVGTYWRVSISGDIDVVPTRVPRKQAAPRCQKKNPLVTGFDVEPIGNGAFYGFTLDGDHLYLTSDFVVHHNSGKSIVIGSFVEEVLKAWPDQRILIVTHVRELIAQNHAEMIGLWPEAPAGIYSAGLGKREARAQILFAGIQSIHRRAVEIGHTDLVLIDEAHLIPGNSSTIYRRFLDALTRINPALKVIGLTATPFRVDSGMLHEGKNALFTDIAFEAPVRDLIDAGYLSPLVSKQPATRLDVSKIGTRAGDFIQRDLASAVDKEAITRAAVSEIIEHGRDRKSWLAFCSGVEHARHVAEEFGRQGIICRTIFGDTPKEERDAIIAAFKRGEIRALASMGVLTTGFNAPAVDLIVLLRPTKSAGLYLQMVGRGTRLAPGKENCLVLDFAGNVRRHGPIDLVRPKRPGEGGGGEAPTKLCPECDSIIALSATECPDCGYVFPAREVKITPTAATLPVLSPKVQWLPVHGVSYSRHDKLGGLPSLKVTYSCGLKSYSEWVCIEHQGYARQKAAEWWRKRAPDCPVPLTVDQAIAEAARLARPSAISVRPSGRYVEISGHRFDPCPNPTPASAPSATGNLVGLVGSTHTIGSPTRAAMPAASTSAAGPAKTSATGGRA
jgi:DNA repair protein RadD